MMYNKKIFKRIFWYDKKYWYKNITRIPAYFRAINFLIKNGYDRYAHWETYNWFIDTMKNVLTEYRKSHIGYPCDSTMEDYDADIDKMISLLGDMDELNPKYETEEYCNTLQDVLKVNDEMEKAKEEFLKLFSKYFYNLWD